MTGDRPKPPRKSRAKAVIWPPRPGARGSLVVDSAVGQLVEDIAYMGSPASETARVVGCEVGAIHSSLHGSASLSRAEINRLVVWASLMALRWALRCSPSTVTDADRADALRLADLLPWVPMDWMMDVRHPIAIESEESQ